MSEKIKIIIYRFSGRQGFFTIPKKWCEECDLLISFTKQVVKEIKMEGRVKFIIRPWFLWFWLPGLRYFVWHAPILIIDSKVVSRGIVPSQEEVKEALKKADKKYFNK